MGTGGSTLGRVAWVTVGSTASLDPRVHIHSPRWLHGGYGGCMCAFPSTIDLHLCFFLSRRMGMPRIADFTNPSAGSMTWRAFLLIASGFCGFHLVAMLTLHSCACRSKMSLIGHLVRPGGLR
jgi:hypothetical protein